MEFKKVATIGLHGFIGWFFCAATMGIGISLLSLNTALIIHAIAAPIIFVVVSLVYFTRYNFTKPLLTAIVFVSVVIFIDVLFIALIVNKSFTMFKSFIGTWLPFILIFCSTFITGLVANRINNKE